MKSPHLGTAFCLLLVVAAPAVGQPILVDQQPTRSGGFAADSDFPTEFGDQHYSATVADNIYLVDSAQVVSVIWWGFYYLLNAPQTETMRIRFYAARAGDDLPDEYGINGILYDQTIVNPIRELTGETVHTGFARPEYRYTVNLLSPLPLAAETKYWIELTQIGDPDSDFYWEFGRRVPHDGIAGKSTAFPDWHTVGPPADLAFQLIAPEPSAVLLLIGASFWVSRVRRLGETKGDESEWH
jgi:hypothetical protein